MSDRIQLGERRPLRIAHLVSHGSQNGVGTSVKTLIDEQIRAGHQVMLVHPARSWIGEQSFAGPLEKRVSTFRTRPADLRATGYPIRDWGRSLVHAHGSVANKFLMVFRVADGVPAVMTAHARYMQLPWRFAHAVIAPSRQTADYYLKTRLVPAERMHVMPHVFNGDGLSAATQQSRGAARDALGLRRDSFVLGSVGTICRRKNQVDMLRVLKRCVEAGVDGELLLIGASDGDAATPDWHALLNDAALAGRVHLAGHRPDAAALLHAMDVFLCTSRVEEGPIALFEAMATALPVLCVDVGFASEIIEEGRNGHIFRHGDIEAIAAAAQALAAQPSRRAEIGAAARGSVLERLSPANQLAKIEQVYWQAMAAARDRGKAYFRDKAHRIDFPQPR